MPDAWPRKINLNGFTYRSLQGLTVGAQAPMAYRPQQWFTDWLGKQEYAPQPYLQLASSLRSIGRTDAADEVLYAGRKLERDRAPFWGKIWLTAMDWLIGFGFHLERSLYWIAGFLIAGVLVMWLSGEGTRNNISKYGVAYSFDMLLPVIKLREKHDEIDLEGWPRYYFYVHKIMGFVLASFLIAGLSGLAK